MRSAACKVKTLSFFEAVVRPKVQHLPQGMRHGERGPLVQCKVSSPVGGRQYPLRADALADVTHPDIRHLVQHLLTKRSDIALPINSATRMRYRGQHIERAHTLWCQRVVTYGCILHVDRGVAGERVTLLDVVQDCPCSPWPGRSCGGLLRRKCRQRPCTT